MIKKNALVKYVVASYFILFTSEIITKIFLRGANVGTFSPSGVIRFITLAILLLIMLSNLNLFSLREKASVYLVFAIPFFLIIQLLFIEWSGENISGMFKYFFYSLLLAFALLNKDNESCRTIDSMMYLLIVFYIVIVSVYPFIVPSSFYYNPVNYFYSIGMGFRLNEGFLGAANEDANFLSSIFPLLLFKTGNRKLVKMGLVILTFLILLINGTRSAIMMMLITTFIYMLYGQNKERIIHIRILMLTIISFVIVLFIIPYFTIIFYSERNLFENFNNLLNYGDATVEGNFAYRVIKIWTRPIYYTIENSPMFGFGSGGWDFVALKLRIVNPFNLFKVESPHNSLIYFFVCWGLIGVIVFLIIIICGFGLSIKCLFKNTDTTFKNLSLSIFLSWISFIAWSLIANAYSTHGWIILSIFLIITILNYRQIFGKRIV